MNCISSWRAATFAAVLMLTGCGGLDTEQPAPVAAARAQALALSGWSATGALGTGRYAASGALLFSGKVLAVGGLTTPGPSIYVTGTSELFDPGAGTWSATGSLATPRKNLGLVRLRSGKVLAVGGLTAGSVSLSSAELYDPGTGAWTPAGALATARTFSVAVLLSSGKVLVAGGTSSPVEGTPALASCEVYDPATSTFSPTGSMIGARALPAVTVLGDGRVLVSGGFSAMDFTSDLASAEIYDPSTGHWTATSSMSEVREGLRTEMLKSGKVLAIGGVGNGVASATTELWDPTTGHWTAGPTLASTRYAAMSSLLADGSVLVVGGINAAGVALASSERLDPSTNTWSSAGSLAEARYGGITVRLVNGDLLTAGGTAWDLTGTAPPSFTSAERFAGPVPGALIVTPAGPSVAPGGTVAFGADGGSLAGYAWSLATNSSGGTIDAATGAYKAGSTGSVADVVRVTDSFNGTAETTVTISAAPPPGGKSGCSSGPAGAMSLALLALGILMRRRRHTS